MDARRDETAASAAARARARAVREAGGVDAAVAAGALPGTVEVTLSEGLVLALLKQGVRKYFAIFGHGSTDLGEMLRVYGEEGLARTVNCRHEVEAAHAATTLSWQHGEVCAVVTSIGPGALQAMAGSLAAASNGVGVYHVYGDETTHGEGYNMQQVPKREQGLFGQVTALMGESHVLHTPGSLRDCMRRGANRVFHPHKAGPFYLLLPLNTQPKVTRLALGTLPGRPRVARQMAEPGEAYREAARLIRDARRPAMKVGGGARGHDALVRALAETARAPAVLSPGSTGALPDAHPLNMHVGGSKGSVSGNHAMANADLLVALGTRAVCQADCSGVGYPNATAVVNLNGDLADATHYANTVALPGDLAATVPALLAELRDAGVPEREEWLGACAQKKAEWAEFKRRRYGDVRLPDAAWGREVLTQPAAIKAVADYAKANGRAKYFDAGDVQANGFQIVEDDRTGDTYTESGASYMGYAVSALLASAVAERPRYGIAFSGDGSFMMNPQILVDAVEHGARGMIALFDNRRMSAITGLQLAQYGHEHGTNDSVEVDYVRLAEAVKGVRAAFGGHDLATLRAALEELGRHDGLSLLHIPVYAGPDPLGGMGAYGSWNVGNWVDDVQARMLDQHI